MSYKKFILFLVLFLAVLLAGFEFINQKEKKNRAALEVYFFDVGQGDATLVNYLNGYQVLIDGGPNGKKLLSELGKAMPVMDKNIELVILTHPDKDHLAGLIEVAKNYEIGLILDNGQEADTEIYRELKETISQEEIRREMIPEGSKIRIGNQLEFAAFNPDELASAQADRNDHSVVLRMDYGENSFLFTGDAEMNTEKDMIGDLENLNIDWLKIGHHGSNSSTSDSFLKITSPQYAIISAGKDNRYGHPTDEIMSRLQDSNIKILRTDESGTIKIDCQTIDTKCE